MRGKAMTSHYIDLRVLPDPETSAPQLLGVLFGKLHLALVQQRIDDIGASFPQYSNNPRGLGNLLRLHGSETALKNLLEQDWLKGIRDHVRMTEITLAPQSSKHVVVTRKQFKTSVERLRRRRMKRQGETAAQAAAAIPSTVERTPDLPYLHLNSVSTSQSFCLFIKQKIWPEPAPGKFNSYGLSHSTTVPLF